jgi:hypothetical protein
MKTLDPGLIRAFLVLPLRAGFAVCARSCARSRRDDEDKEVQCPHPLCSNTK